MLRLSLQPIAEQVATSKSVNVVLLGALATRLDFSEEVWKEVISKRVPPKTVEANLRAFDAGYEFARRGRIMSVQQISVFVESKLGHLSRVVDAFTEATSASEAIAHPTPAITASCDSWSMTPIARCRCYMT